MRNPIRQLREVWRATIRIEGMMTELSGAVGRLDAAVAQLAERIGQLDTAGLVRQVEEWRATAAALSAELDEARGNDELDRTRIAELTEIADRQGREIAEAVAAIDAETSEISALAPAAGGSPEPLPEEPVDPFAGDGTAGPEVGPPFTEQEIRDRGV